MPNSSVPPPASVGDHPDAIPPTKAPEEALPPAPLPNEAAPSSVAEESTVSNEPLYTSLSTIEPVWLFMLIGAAILLIIGAGWVAWRRKLASR